jgi:tetratricopeptide (TPR) repeat protein
MRKLLFLLVFSLSPAWASEPSIAEVERVERLSAGAAEHYRAGRFQDAITLYQDAWNLLPSPGVLYNLARCHEALGRWVEAADRFDKVVVDGSAAPGLRARAAERSRHARQQAAKAASAPPPEAPVLAAPPTAPPPAPVPEEETAWLRPSAWVLGSVGLAAVVTGSILVGMGNGDLDELEAAKEGGLGRLTRVEALEMRSQGESRRSAGTVTLVLGGASLLGAVFILTQTHPPASGRITPSPAGLSVRF